MNAATIPHVTPPVEFAPVPQQLALEFPVTDVKPALLAVLTAILVVAAIVGT